MPSNAFLCPFLTYAGAPAQGSNTDNDPNNSTVRAACTISLSNLSASSLTYCSDSYCVFYSARFLWVGLIQMLVIKIFAKCLASLESWCLLRSLLGKVVDLYNLHTGNINPHVFFPYPHVCASNKC